MLVGLGTGSTVAFAIKALGERVAAGLQICAVATSHVTAAAARGEGIEIVDLPASGSIDLAIDGVDEIDPLFLAVKGAGGALLREKIVATAAVRMIAVTDQRKLVDRIGEALVPVEVLPFGEALVRRELAALDAAVHRRVDAAGAAWTSDQGNLILDCRFATIDNPVRLAGCLERIPGVLGHGLFLDEIDALYVGSETGVVSRERRRL